MTKVSFVERDEDQFIDVRDGGDLAVGEGWGCSSNREPGALLRMPLRSGAVVVKNGHRGAYDLV